MDEEKNEVSAIAEKMEVEIRKLTATPPGGVTARPHVSMTAAKAEELLHDKTRLRVESIIQMAFQVWMQEMRGVAPMWGPADSWKLNEVKRILFSVGRENNDF